MAECPTRMVMGWVTDAIEAGTDLFVDVKFNEVDCPPDEGAVLAMTGIEDERATAIIKTCADSANGFVRFIR